MLGDIDVNAEEEDDMIKKLAKKIHAYGMEPVAILALETSKPLIYIGGELGRFFIFPFTSIISEDFAEKTEKIFLTFEKRPNIEKLINILEDQTKEEKPKSNVAPEQASTEPTTPQKKGWRRYLPFLSRHK